MENITKEIIEKSMAQWMADEGLTDAGIADDLGVTRQTVWRWRKQGVLPHQRDRVLIMRMAGDGVVILFGAS